MDYQRKEFKMIITDEYLRVITPIILDNQLVIVATVVPVIEIIIPTFHDIDYVILN